MMMVTGLPVFALLLLVMSAAGKNQVGAVVVDPSPLSTACGTAAVPPTTDSPKNQLLKAIKNAVMVDQIVLTNFPGSRLSRLIKYFEDSQLRILLANLQKTPPPTSYPKKLFKL